MDQEANAIRIRNNQRRSRAKQKELVNSLQQRLREYEAQGVQASAEMQRAARKVALENKRLRMLLQQKGVSSAEVDCYMSSFEQGLQIEAPRDLVSTNHKIQNSAFEETYNKKVSHNPDSSKDEGISSDMEEGGVTLDPKNMILGDTVAKSRCEDVESSPSPVDSGFETSCKKAAGIILQMRGDGDEQTIFSKLGCRSPDSCTMKNTTIFQLLDEI